MPRLPSASVLYLWIAPGNLPADLIGAGASDVPMQKLGSLSYYDHFLSVIPNNMLQPFLAGNVLSVMLIAASVGLALAFMPKTENRTVLLKGIYGLQELLFTLIRALLWALPAGILAFAAQLSRRLRQALSSARSASTRSSYSAATSSSSSSSSALPARARPQPALRLPQDGTGHRRRALHEELGRHAAGNARLC